MTIKEMEECSGMTRANIRFYEGEGLFSPARGENGYRNYSEQDLAVLKRIKLLRSLHISLEEIKAIQNGAEKLAEILNRQLEQLTAEQERLQSLREVCRKMRDDGVLYETLDAQKYLDSMDRKDLEAAPELVADQAPRAWVPWRRFFARMFDRMLYSFFWNAFLLLVCHVRITERNGAETFLDFVVLTSFMLLLEPLFLSLFGATPGKWIFGLRVTDNYGRRLTYRAALARTSQLLFQNCCFFPIISWILMLKHYRNYDKSNMLPWEYDSEETVKDTKNWRILGMIGASLLLVIGFSFAVFQAELPKHRGELTVAEFCENYNQYLRYYGMDGRYSLDSAGGWIENREPGVYYVSVGEEQEQPEFSFVEKNGHLTEIYLKGHSAEPIEGKESLFLFSRGNEIVLSAMSFALAQDGVGWSKKEMNTLLEKLETPFEDFSLILYGIEVSCRYEFSGCIRESGNIFSPEPGAETAEYSFVFTMKKAA